MILTRRAKRCKIRSIRNPSCSILNKTIQCNRFFQIPIFTNNIPVRWYSSSQTSDDVAIGKIKPMMKIQFTCKCGHRLNKQFSKHSYQKGVVIIKCENCASLHLIADNLGWFQHIPGKNIEDYSPAKRLTMNNITKEDLSSFPDDWKEAINNIKEVNPTPTEK
eukprot:TRINITY_DN9397_c0_g1_i1.p1 TRINITY_DN9397_c0_g1~~TRINITY_DN9397_c0_g1_i1.p1  ORF type:complete len:163 (-),score=28.83 TRINITY_DN9397_c0_g1_i1:64-552(-)